MVLTNLFEQDIVFKFKEGSFHFNFIFNVKVSKIHTFEHDL